MRVLFLIPYPKDEAASQRFRFEQYLSELDNLGITYELAPFLSKKVWDILYDRGRFVAKAFGILSGYFRRWGLILKIRRYDCVFIHREIKPIGLPIAEWVLCKTAKKVIYDFDDAIWLRNYSESNKLFSFAKRYGNVRSLCKWSDRVSVGNTYLADFAKKYNRDVRVNPTTIDTGNYHNKLSKHEDGRVVIGWTGSHSTVGYLKLVEPVLNKLQTMYNVEFLVISDLKPELDVKTLTFIKWCKDTEIEDLLKMDIGIMPLEDSPWARGKCGFKALQYMALGIPAVVSDVGVNADIVENNVNGFLCRSASDWEEHLIRLITDTSLRKLMGSEARRKIESHFSVNSNRSNFIHLFTDLKITK